MKKSVSLLLAALMLTGALAGCGSSASGTQAADGADSGVSGAITVISREDGSGTRGAFIELTGVEEKTADGKKVDNTTADAEIANMICSFPAGRCGHRPLQGTAQIPGISSRKDIKYMGFFEKLKQGLSKTASSISSVFTASELDDEFYDDLEESLIVSDLGMDTTEAVMDRLRQTAKEQRIKTVDEAKLALRGILADMLNVGDPALKLDTKPSVILVIGVNGVGKTTTIGKLAHQLHDQGKKVLLCAGDTFRAAAADQLEIWSERAHCDIIRQHEGADPASVVFDAIAAARARGSDVIICDTAGRLHNKQNLMNELNKISRILDRELPGASKEVLLVLDGTTGQNGLLQARQFQECAGVTGMVLTKLDGTAKGGVVIAVAQALHIPVKFIGVGEQIDDLMPFDAKSFAEALI